MPDASPSVATFTVLGGPLDRQRLDTDEAVDEILIGSDTDCRFCLDAPGVSPIHARIWIDLDGVTVHDTHSPRGVYVNDDRVAGQAPLRDRDILWLGPPGAEDSVMIECRFASPAMQDDAAVPAAEPAGPDDTILDLVSSSPDAAPARVMDAARPAGPAETGDASALADLMTDEAPEADAYAGSAQLQDLVAPAPAPPTPSAEEGAIEFFMDDSVGEPAVEPVPLPPVAAAPPPAAESSAFDELLVVDPAPQPAAEEFFMDEPAPPQAAQPEPPVDEFFVEESPAAVIFDEAFPQDEPAAPPPVAPAMPPPVPPRQAPVAAAATTPKAPVPTPAAARPAAPPSPPARPSAAPARPPAPPAAAPPPAASPRSPEPRRAPTPAPARSRSAAPRGGLPPMAKYGALAAAVLLVLGGVAFLVSRSSSAPKLEAVNPARVAAGQVLTLTGQNFAPDPQGNAVRFEGGRSARVVKASARELQVEVPDLSAAAGKPVAVTVSVGGRESTPLQVTVFQTPRIHGVSPSVAMPGEEVTLAGTGWGTTAKVRFGSAEAPVVTSSATALRVRVPEAAGVAGTSVPVVVAMGSDTSNAFPFLVGRLPLATGIEPKTASAGDVVAIAGRGFQAQAASNAVRIGGVPALVVSSSDVEVKAIVPRGAAPGPEVPVEVRVAGLDNAAQATLTVSPALDPVEFSFAAEPYVCAAGHEHALLATGLGPAFVLSATGKLSAAERAAEAQRRLSAAAVTLRAARGEDLEVRGVDADPVIVLMGKSDPILEVAEEDAAAYNEDWTKLGGRGGPVTRGRLALWWGAVARDLVLMLVRGESPRHAAGLAPEGKVFVDLFEAARRTGRFGVPQEVIEGARPATREALRIAGLRVPAAVAGPPGQGAPAAAPEAGAAGLKLAGVWSGEENDSEGRKFVTVRFTGNTGTLSYQRALSVSVPLTAVEQSRRGEVRYSVKMARETRFYVGRWDGEKISGRIFSDAAGTAAIGSFEMSPER